MAIQFTSYTPESHIPDLPGSNTFHSTELFRVYASTRHYHPILVVGREGDVVLCKLLAVVKRSDRLLSALFFHRCEIYGEGEYFLDDAHTDAHTDVDTDICTDAHTDASPLYSRDCLFAQMLEHLTREVEPYCFIIEFRNLSTPLFGFRSFRQQHYFAINWLRVYNSLHSVAQAEEYFSPSRLRQVKKGLAAGAQVSEARTLSEVEAFARMLRHNYSWKIRRHFPSPEFFKQVLLLDADNCRAKVFIVTYEGTVIGGSMCFYSHDRAYLWFSGGYRKGYVAQCPGVLAVWGAMREAKAAGYRHFEFSDVGLPFRAHGYREFVLRFGGRQVSTRRWFRFRWRWLNSLLRRFYD